MKLAIDCDGILADFNTAYGDLLIKVSGVDLFKESYKLNPEYPRTWFWGVEEGYTKAHFDAVWDIIRADDTFWESLGQYPDAEASIKVLNKLRNQGNDVYFVTNRMGKNCKEQTENWLMARGMVCPTVITVANKLPILDTLGIEFFIDDRLPTIREADDYYTEKRKFGYILLCDRPWNRVDREGLRVVNSLEHGLREAGLWIESKPGRPRSVWPKMGGQ